MFYNLTSKTIYLLQTNRVAIRQKKTIETGNEFKFTLTPLLKCNMTQKDSFETRIHHVICDGKLSVNDAQDLLYNHWEDGYKIYINNKGC